MPLYSFICNDCGAQFELLVGMTRGEEEKVCKKCGSTKISRQMSSFSLGKSSGTGGNSSCTTST
jgi:putative FmdB family regulatory protein